MTNKVSIIALTLGALSFGPQAWAQTTPQIVSGRSDIGIVGVVPPMCSLASPTVTGDGVLTQGTSTSITITLSQFTDAAGLAMASDSELTYPNATCNFASHLSLLSAKGGLKPNSATIPPGFSGVVHYVATATWGTGGAQTSLDTSANSVKGNNNGVSIPPLSDQLTLIIHTKTSPLPLVNVGSPYTDTLSLQVGEAL